MIRSSLFLMSTSHKPNWKTLRREKRFGITRKFDYDIGKLSEADQKEIREKAGTSEEDDVEDEPEDEDEDRFDF